MKLFVTDPDNPQRIRPPSPPASFGLPVRTLHIAAHWLNPATGALLAAEIGRNPANLHLHVQRISLWKSLSDEHELGAAVVDLCLTLGPLGLDLRKRMLSTYRQALLRVGLAEFLDRSLVAGADRHDPQAARPGVVLARPVAGRRQFLRNTNLRKT